MKNMSKHTEKGRKKEGNQEAPRGRKLTKSEST